MYTYIDKNIYLCKIGDVIQTDDNWIYGHGITDHKNGIFTVGNKRENIVLNTKDKVIKARNRKDKSRAKAYFLVIKTEYSGGGYGHGSGDYYPDGHKVYCKRLNKDKTFNPEGEECYFYQTGSFNCKIEAPNVIGYMEQVITWSPFQEITNE